MSEYARCQECGGSSVENPYREEPWGSSGGFTTCGACGQITLTDSWNKRQHAIRARKRFEMVKEVAGRMSGNLDVPDETMKTWALGSADAILNEMYGEIGGGDEG